MAEKARRKTPFDVFVEGARKGYNIAVNSMTPNVVMAFVLIQFLNMTGLLTLIGKLFAPVMGIFGLPGVAATVLISAFLSTGGGMGAAASLFSAGQIAGTHCAILLPAIVLMGSLLQYMGRLLGVAEVQTKYYPILFAICIVNAMISMVLMNIIVKLGIFA
jgi:spore maturation protein SpmB